MDQAAAKAELLPHAAGQFFRRTVGKWREAGALEQLGDLRVPLGARLSEQAAEELDVLAHAEVGVEILAQSLRHVGDARTDRCAMRRIRHVAVEDESASGLHLPRAGHDAEQRGLSDAVGTDEPDHAAGGNRDPHRVERDRLSVSLRRRALDAGRPERARPITARRRSLAAWGGQATAGSNLT